MKKANILICCALVIITGCLIYLFSNGISLRAAKLIKPSIYRSGGVEAADAVISRMFPDFSEKNILILGVPLDTPEGQIFVDHLKEAYLRNFKQEPHMITDSEKLESCKGPCWLVTTPEAANSLEGEHPEFGKNPKNYLTLLMFNRNTEPSVECRKKLRLNLSCLKELSIHEASRKIKTAEPHFFLNKYAENNFFVFIGKF